MQMPFTVEQFRGVFRGYNPASWPARWVFVAMALAALAVPPAPPSPLTAPLLCCLVGAQAAFLFGVWSDPGLIAAGAVGIGLPLTAGQPHRTPTP